MSADDRQMGLDLEKNHIIHDIIRQITECDSVIVEGNSRVKSDITTNNGIRFSLKYTSGKSTQVYLTTLKAFNEKVNMPSNIYNSFDMFFGSSEKDKINMWMQKLPLGSEEIRRSRVHTNNIDNINDMLSWLDDNVDKICKFAFKSVDEMDKCVKYLIWASKKTGKVIISDVDKLIDIIKKRFKWYCSDTVFHCINTITGEKILHLQMKGSGNNYHCPQFHIHNNFPVESVVYESTNEMLIRRNTMKRQH